MTTMFTYNQEAGIKAGASDYINQSGAYIGNIVSAKWVKGANTQSAALELAIKGEQGEANYLSAYYLKKDGSDNASGIRMINAIIGLLKIPALTQRQEGKDSVCPELIGKPIGLVLQKVLKTKGDGSETYGFEIKMPFGPNSRKTLSEAVSGAPATAVDSILATLKDKDERRTTGSHSGGSGSPQTGRAVDQFEDEIPWS